MKNISDINKIAIPLIISSLSSIFMNIIDQAIIDRISTNAYAGIGVVFTCINSLVGVLGAFSIAFNIMGSKAKGENNINKLNQVFTSSVILNAVIGIALYLLIFIFSKVILSNFFALKGEVLNEATSYIKIYSISILLNLIIFIYSTVFKIFRNTKNILIVTVIVNIINVILDYVLVFGKLGFAKLGSKGAGLGTIIALFINMIIYIIISRKFVSFQFRGCNTIKNSVQIFRFSISFIAQELTEDIIFVICINAIVSRLGVLPLSSYTLLLQIISVVLMPMFAYSNASLSLVSEYHSQENTIACKEITKTICIILSIIYLMFITIVALFNCSIPSIISSDKALIDYSSKYLILAVGIQIFNYIFTVYKSSLQAIGFEKYSLKITFIINIICIIAIFYFGKDLYMIYLIMGASYIVNAVIFYKKYKLMLK